MSFEGFSVSMFMSWKGTPIVSVEAWWLLSALCSSGLDFAALVARTELFTRNKTGIFCP